jgi:molybdopterin-guanine dinucleotide biosynthesis protein A
VTATDQPVSSIAGIVLAGGSSTRFGSDKLRATYRGRPLLHHAIARVEAVSEDVVVVMGPAADGRELPPSARLAHDSTEGEGPLAGLHAGLLAAVRSDIAVVVAGDMPDVPASVLGALIDVLRSSEHDAAALGTGDGLQPVPIAVRTWPAADAVHTLLHAGRRRLGDVLDVLNSAVIPQERWIVLDPDRRSLFDVDEPDDLER